MTAGTYPTKEEEISFGMPIRQETLIEISTIKCWFEGNAVHLENTKHCFKIAALGIADPAPHLTFFLSVDLHMTGCWLLYPRYYFHFILF